MITFFSMQARLEAGREMAGTAKRAWSALFNIYPKLDSTLADTKVASTSSTSTSKRHAIT
jgi:hypothetical protein